MGDPHSLPRQRHIFSQNHDFTLVVFDTVFEKFTDGNGVTTWEYVPVKAYEYQVARNVIEGIPYFRAIFAPRGFNDTGKSFHELREDDPVAWKIWLQILHNCVNDTSYEVNITTVWNVLVVAEKYELSPKREDAKNWFADWYSHWGDPETVDDCCEALYPCHTFDHARGFSRATKLLAYECDGTIGEQKPDGVYESHLRLDHRVTQQLNAARGRLRTILYRELHKPVKTMLDDDQKNTCQYKERVLWAYQKGLADTGAWPTEHVSAKHSIDTLFSKLRRFEYTDPHPGGTTSCFHCPGNFINNVNNAIATTKDYFEGLCLDCMNSSKTGDKDEDYWKYLSKDSQKGGRASTVPFDEGCRLRHSEPSWYFSFNGSRKEFEEWRFARR